MPQSPVAVAPAQGQPHVAPSGSSPATGPTPNQGYAVAAQKMTGLALLVLEHALPLAGAGSELGRDIHSSIGRLARHVPPGTVTPQDVKNVIQQLLIKQEQFQQNVQALRARQAQGQQQGGAPQGAPQAAPQAAAA